MNTLELSGKCYVFAFPWDVDAELLSDFHSLGTATYFTAFSLTLRHHPTVVSKSRDVTPSAVCEGTSTIPKSLMVHCYVMISNFVPGTEYMFQKRFFLSF